MRSILQLCVLLLLVLSGQVHVWSKVDVSENIAVRGFEGILVDCTDPDAPPSLMALWEPGPCHYDFASDVRNGPNLYANVRWKMPAFWRREVMGLSIKLLQDVHARTHPASPAASPVETSAATP